MEPILEVVLILSSRDFWVEVQTIPGKCESFMRHPESSRSPLQANRPFPSLPLFQNEFLSLSFHTIMCSLKVYFQVNPSHVHKRGLHEDSF